MRAGQLSVRTVASCYNCCAHSLPTPFQIQGTFRTCFLSGLYSQGRPVKAILSQTRIQYTMSMYYGSPNQSFARAMPLPLSAPKLTVFGSSGVIHHPSCSARNIKAQSPLRHTWRQADARPLRYTDTETIVVACSVDIRNWQQLNITLPSAVQPTPCLDCIG